MRNNNIIDAHPIDLVFPIAGDKIEVAHGYLLYSAIVTVCPRLHDTESIGVHLIRGSYAGDGLLRIEDWSKLVIRMPESAINSFLCLAGKKIRLGLNEIFIGIPEINYLVPGVSLYAHLVTTKNGHDESRFKTEIAKQLLNIGVTCDTNTVKRKTFAIHGKQIVGYSLTVNSLSPSHSLKLQAQGLGGRRKMGCGIFLPAPAASAS